MAFLNLFPSSYVLFFSPGDLINVGCFLSLTWKESPSFAKWYGSNFGLFPLKLSKIWKLRQMVYRNFPEEFPEIRISEMRTIQPKILEIPGAKLKEGKLLGKSYRKFGCNSRGCPLFENFGKCCSIRYWKLPKIQTGRQRPLSRTETYPSPTADIVGPSNGIDLSVWGGQGTYYMGFWFYWKGVEEIFLDPWRVFNSYEIMFFLAAHIRPCYLTSSGILLSSFLDSRRSCRKGRALLELRLAEQTADVRAIIKTMQTNVLGFIIFLAKKRNKKILCKSNFLINTVESR